MHIKILILTIAFGLVLTADSDDDEYDQWMKKFKKFYTRSEGPMRRQIWIEKNKLIKKHNEEASKGKHTFKMAHNELSDKSQEELARLVLSKQQLDLLEKNSRNGLANTVPLASAPLSKNWVKEGFDTPVRNQGGCGSCWAFAASATLEAHYYFKTKKFLTLSPQQLVSCDTVYSGGCRGGWPQEAFEYYAKYGAMTEDSYPYTATDSSCMYDSTKIKINVTGKVWLPQGDENALTNALGTIGPVVMSFAVTQKYFSYSSGVFYDPDCYNRSKIVGWHATIAVGYGTDNTSGLDYYYLKNSWGTYWGMKGYFMMARNRNDMCHLTYISTYPLGVTPLDQISTASTTSTTTTTTSTTLKTKSCVNSFKSKSFPVHATGSREIYIIKADLTNCLLFYCTEDSNCKKGSRCINNRCSGITNIRCDTNGTIYRANTNCDVYYTPYNINSAYPIPALNWFDAKKKCESIGASLLTIRDNEEYEFLKIVMRSISKKHCSWCYGNDFHRWIGASSSPESKDAYWLDGRLADQSLFRTSPGACYLWDMSDPSQTIPFIGSKGFCMSTQPYICKF